MRSLIRHSAMELLSPQNQVVPGAIAHLDQLRAADACQEIQRRVVSIAVSGTVMQLSFVGSPPPGRLSAHIQSFGGTLILPQSQNSINRSQVPVFFLESRPGRTVHFPTFWPRAERPLYREQYSSESTLSA
ncbi:hypothetical protein CISG_05556 [Coccidioides immitis RMSCC 3703]|uniref:Uncharacterized protein n=2 Tax=Coccidioides immitis TaxID=5501 RepID=A0A0J8QXU6_COCIT|nr:hypothetical protein CIRG_02781 [Coccidioides immitis RMSCC 2394]KMU76188.1 hypothetical protein CISG_05556 [Coccidioides immitis RMSCC 3703]